MKHGKVDYEHAINDMVIHTGTEYVPWTQVSGNDKRPARIEVLKTVCDMLDSALDV